MTFIKNINVYAVFLGVYAVVYGSYDSYLIAMLTTFERRFSLPSKLSGLIVSMGDIGYLIAVLPVSFYGKGGHRPRCLGILGLVLSAGVAIMTSPYFIFGPMKGAAAMNASSVDSFSSSFSLCANSTNKTNAQSSSFGENLDSLSGDSSMAYAILIAGGFLVGVGSTPFWNLGLAYIDDHVPKIRAPVYISAMMALRFLAPVPGYITGGELAKVPETLYGKHEGVGAWWLGLIILGSLTTIFSMTMFLFPKKMDNAWQTPKEIEMPEKLSSAELITNGETTAVIAEVISTPNLTKDIFGTIKRTAKNIAFITLLAGTAIEFLAFIGFLAFLPKFYELNFGKTKSVASISAGMVEGLASALGTLAGGIFMNKAPCGLRKILFATMLTCFIGGFLGSAGILFNCKETPSVSGINTMSHEFKRESTCSKSCQCTNSYAPVCFQNMSIINPCEVGCKTLHFGKSGMESLNSEIASFSNCGCYGNATAIPGLCRGEEPECEAKFWLYNAYYFVLNFITGSVKIIICMIIIRSINPKDKDIGFGFITFASSGAASLSPILFGAIVDTQCLYSETSPSNVFAQCKLYNIQGIRLWQHLLRSILRILTGAVFVLSVITSRNNKYIIESEREIERERLHQTRKESESLNLNEC